MKVIKLLLDFEQRLQKLGKPALETGEEQTSQEDNLIKVGCTGYRNPRYRD